MPFNTQGFGNMFGGVPANIDAPSQSDISYVRNTPVPQKVGGIEAGTVFNTDIIGVIDMLLYPYQNPVVSITSSVKTSTRQKGVDVINGMVLTATCTKKTSPLFKVEFYMGTTLLNSQDCVDGKTVYTYEYTGTITDITTFSAKIYDTKSKTGTSSIKYNFYYPNFSCATTSEIADITIDEIIDNGTMRLEAKANKTITFNGNMSRYIFSYPQAWGNVTSVLDDKGFEYLPSFKKVTMTYISGTDSVPMYSYILQEPCSLTNYKMTFKF
jgi:hypothetical protein